MAQESWFQRNFQYIPTDDQFLLHGNTQITNTIDGSDRVTKKEYQVYSAKESDYVTVYEIVYTYTSTNVNYTTATGADVIFT